MNIFVRLSALLVLTLALTTPPSLAQNAPQSLDVGLTSKTATDWPLYVADSLGYFKKYGLTVNFIIIGSAAGNAQQLAGGSLPIGETSSTQIVEAIRGGAPITYILNQVTTPPYRILAKPEIHSLAQLKGKTIIVGGVNDITRVFTDQMFKEAGLKPADFTYTFAGATTERFAALKSGGVDAAILFPPFDFLAQAQGYNDIGSVEKYFPSFPFDGFATNKAWAQAHPAILIAFIKGYIDGVRWLNNPANKEAAVKLLSQSTNTTPADADKTYDALFRGVKAFSPDGRTKPADFQKVLEAMVDLKVLQPPLPAPTMFFDNHYVDEALAQDKR